VINIIITSKELEKKQPLKCLFYERKSFLFKK